MSGTVTDMECYWGSKYPTEVFDAAYDRVNGQQANCWWVPRGNPSLYEDADHSRGIIDLGPFVDERFPKFWEEYVKNREVPAATRKNALTAWLWVRALLR